VKRKVIKEIDILLLRMEKRRNSTILGDSQFSPAPLHDEGSVKVKTL
jgi:hypothetical protein